MVALIISQKPNQSCHSLLFLYLILLVISNLEYSTQILGPSFENVPPKNIAPENTVAIWIFFLQSLV